MTDPPTGNGNGFKPPPVPPTVHLMATAALVMVAIVTVATTCYAAVARSSQVAMTLLGTLATGSMGALIVLAGGRGKAD